MKRLKLIICMCLWALTSIAIAETSPINMLESTANAIVSELKAHKGHLHENPQLINQLVSRHLLPNVDVKGMARSVLGRQAWNAATGEQRQAFTSAFTQLVIRTYATPLAEYTDETIAFLPQRSPINGRFTRVSSVIHRSNGQNIPLNYSLVLKGGSWKIYDLSVEGVSLLQSFRSQFAQALQSESLNDLIIQMKKNNKAV